MTGRLLGLFAIGCTALGCVAGSKALPLAAGRSGCDSRNIQIVKEDGHDLVLAVCGVHEDWRFNAFNGWQYVGRSAVQPPAPVVDRDGDGVKDDVDACPTASGPASPNPAANGCPPPPDADGDGVPDGVDPCPQLAGPASPTPGLSGCPDADGDGVPDPKDACPDKPGVAGADAATSGCPADKDGDGVPDEADRCPEVAGVASAVLAVNGCPDRDGDGIVDDQDACPEQAGPPDDKPEKHGCPVPPGPNTGLPECDRYITALEQCLASIDEKSKKPFAAALEDIKGKLAKAGEDEAKKKRLVGTCATGQKTVDRAAACKPPKPPQP